MSPNGVAQWLTQELRDHSSIPGHVPDCGFDPQKGVCSRQLTDDVSLSWVFLSLPLFSLKINKHF